MNHHAEIVKLKMKHRLRVTFNRHGVLFLRGQDTCQLSSEDSPEDLEKLRAWLVELGLESSYLVNCLKCDQEHDVHEDCPCRDGLDQCSVCCEWFPESEVRGYWCKGCKGREKAKHERTIPTKEKEA